MAQTAGAVENQFECCLGRSVSLDHAAELLGVSRRTVYNRIREGRLQTIRTRGGSQRVLLESIVSCGAKRPEIGFFNGRVFES